MSEAKRLPVQLFNCCVCIEKLRVKFRKPSTPLPPFFLLVPTSCVLWITLADHAKGDGLGGGNGSVDAGGWATSPPVPLFKLTPGMAANSHGIACAKLAGGLFAVISTGDLVPCALRRIYW